MAIPAKKHLDQRTRFKLTQLITLEFPTAKIMEVLLRERAQKHGNGH